jgi:hypothetical protein
VFPIPASFDVAYCRWVYAKHYCDLALFETTGKQTTNVFNLSSMRSSDVPTLHKGAGNHYA